MTEIDLAPGCGYAVQLRVLVPGVGYRIITVYCSREADHAGHHVYELDRA